MVDHMSCSHFLAIIGGVFSGSRRDYRSEFQNITSELDSSTANTTAAIDLFRREMSDLSKHVFQSQMMMCTYDQNPCILPGLDLKSMKQRLEGCPEGQAMTRCFNEVQGLGIVSAMQLVDQLILGIAALTGGGSYPGHVVTGFEAHTIRSDVQDGSSAIIPDDMESLGSAIVVISTLSAIDCHLVLQ